MNLASSNFLWNNLKCVVFIWNLEQKRNTKQKFIKFVDFLENKLVEKWKMFHSKIFMGRKKSTVKKTIKVCVSCAWKYLKRKLKKYSNEHLWCFKRPLMVCCCLFIPFSSFEHVHSGAGATQHTQLLWRLSSVGNLAWLVPQRTGELQDLLSLRSQVSYSVPIAVELLNSHVPHILK